MGKRLLRRGRRLLRQTGSRRLLTNVGGAPCCCDAKIPCLYRYEACAPPNCPAPVGEIYLPCDLCGGNPCEGTTFILDGICYQWDGTDTKYVDCGGEPPPDGFECLPDGAVTTFDDFIDGDCDADECASEFFRAEPCPGQGVGDALCVGVSCEHVPETGCLIFKNEQLGDLCFSVSRKSPKTDPQTCLIVVPTATGTDTCCECTQNNGCDFNVCSPLSAFAEAFGLPVPDPYECCCESDKSRIGVSMFADWKHINYECPACPDKAIRAWEVHQQVSVANGSGTSTSQFTQWGLLDGCDCPDMPDDPCCGEDDPATNGPEVTTYDNCQVLNCCTNFNQCPSQLLGPDSLPDEDSIILNASIAIVPCQSISWSWHFIRPFNNGKVNREEFGSATILFTKLAGDCGAPDCPPSITMGQALPGAELASPSTLELLGVA